MSKKTEDAERKLKKLGKRFRMGLKNAKVSSDIFMRDEVRQAVVQGFSEVVEERREHLEKLRDEIIPERRIRKAGGLAPKKEKE